MAEQIVFYYPEGQPGPICDAVIPDDGDGGAQLLPDLGLGGTEVIAGPYNITYPDGTEFGYRVVCDVDPVTGELFNCRPIFDADLGLGNGSDCILINGECFNWTQTSTGAFGINDNFYVPLQGPNSCTPYDSDINIKPVTFLSPNGSEVTKYSIEKSNPVTYPVNAVIGNEVNSTSIIAKFSADGRSLVVTGTGNGSVVLKLEWDDDPNTYGTALGTISIEGVSFTQSGTEGSSEASISVQSGQTYPISFSGLHPANSVINVNSARTKLCLYDGDGDDCNAEFRIISSDGGVALQPLSLWSPQADQYAVWTNPAQCTLPCLEQTVTYQVAFPQTDTYYFECGADDTGRVFFDDEASPFVTMETLSMTNPDLFPGSSGGVIVAKQVTAGNHTITVKVTNAAIGPIEYETLYIDSTPSWGTISTTAGTAIRDQLDGFDDESGQGLDEVGGFNVPSDSPTQKYLSFGTINATTTTVSTRTAEITLDLTDVDHIIFSVIAGSDRNGGERPNDVDDTWDVSFDNGSSWIKVAPSKQYANMSFDEYDRTYGDWFNFRVSVPSSARVENFTIKFRSGGDTPEIGGSYNGLSSSAFAAAYANCADVFGLYKIQLGVVLPGDCDNPSEASLQWTSNPGGWYIKICQGSPCTEADTLSWVKSGPCTAWNDLMNSYAVWPSSFETLVDTPQTLSYNIYVFSADTLTLEYAADNAMTIDWDGTQVASTSSFTSTSTTTISATAGLHVLTMEVTNAGNSDGNNSWSNNPAGGAWLLTDSNGVKIRASSDLSTSSNANLIWHTRMGTGYDYITTVTPLTTPYAN